MEIQTFGNINLEDPFFDSLKRGYAEFRNWYERKVREEAKAYVQYDDDRNVIGFLYLKLENGILADIDPPRGEKNRLKVGTFKVDAHGTRFGERFIKKIMDAAIFRDVDEIYVTIFDEHDGLIGLLQRYGFSNEGTKTTSNGVECVLIKDMKSIRDDIYLDFPLIQTDNRRKFALGIKPNFHTKLFPDSLLNNDRYDLVRDISHTNSIHKIYICSMRGVDTLVPGDILCIYRIKDQDDLSPAHYRSVVTSICVVEEVKVKSDFSNVENFVNDASAYSVFNRDELTDLYNNNSRLTVIKMTYNTALSRRVNKQRLMAELGVDPEYWGFFSLSNEQFEGLLRIGEVYENIIIN